jgi:hypothetical protein
MTKFEGFLIDNGYIMFAFNAKEMKYYKPKVHIISTMVNLGHSYIHNSDTNLLNKIEQGKSVMENDFTLEDRKKEIVFGLREKDKPSTLISPRPKIRVKKFITINGKQIEVIEDEAFDNSMNIVLSKINFEDILKAMYDDSICFNFDLTKNHSK